MRLQTGDPQPSVTLPSMSIGDAFSAVVRNQGTGEALDPGTRQIMEARFGHDFSSVRVHRDARAARAAQLIGARAFTVGEHIFWGGDSGTPGSGGTAPLLAHELVHVLQQRQGAMNSPLNLGVELADGGASEREADSVALQVMRNGPSGGFTGSIDSAASARAATPVRVRPVLRPAAQAQRRPGQSFTACVNDCLASQGIAGAITTMIWVACGVIGGIGSLGGSLVGPGGTLTGLGVALAGCLAIGTGFPIGVIIGCLKQCWD